MKRSHLMLDGSVLGAVMFALLGVVGCATNEAAPADEGKRGVLQTQPMVSSDADIVAAVSEANGREIEQAKLALTRARTDAVREFAQHMLSMHGQMAQRQNALSQQLGFAPHDNAVSAAISYEASALTTSLENVPQEGFDRAYIESQVTMHQRALDLIDAQLVPLAQSPVLREELLQQRQMIAHHLTMAQQLLLSLPY